jgi:hypothetical protein
MSVVLLAPCPSELGSAEQLTRCHLQGSGNLEDRIDAEVELATLDGPVVGAIDPRSPGKAFLCIAAMLPGRANSFAERLVCK